MPVGWHMKRCVKAVGGVCAASEATPESIYEHLHELEAMGTCWQCYYKVSHGVCLGSFSEVHAGLLVTLLTLK